MPCYIRRVLFLPYKWPYCFLWWKIHYLVFFLWTRSLFLALTHDTVIPLYYQMVVIEGAVVFVQ